MTRTHTPGATATQATRTGPNGTRTYDGSTTREGDTWNHEHTVTGPDGQPLRQNQTTVTRDGTTGDHNSWTRETDITLKDGRTVQHDMTRTREDGTLTVSRDFVGPNGQTRSFDMTRTHTPGQTSTQATRTGPNGTRTYEGSTTREGDTWNHEHTVTGPDGQPLRQNQTTVIRDGTTWTRETDITLKDGRTIQHDMTRTREGNTGTIERSFTGPNGQTTEKTTFLGRMFERTPTSDAGAGAAPQRSGFTVGTGRSNGGSPTVASDGGDQSGKTPQSGGQTSLSKKHGGAGKVQERAKAQKAQKLHKLQQLKGKK
jgi:hypothetical protein